MALNQRWVQQLLTYRRSLAPPKDYSGSDSGEISRHSIDGTLIIYDPEDMPQWLIELESKADENGNVERQEVYA